MKRFVIRELHAEKDSDILNFIVKYEDGIFGEGSIGMWNIKPFAKYGKIYALLQEEEGLEDVVSVVEVLRSFDIEKAYIYGVFTVEKYGKQGYAKTLLEHVIDHLKDEGISVIELTVEISNANAVNLYKKLEFSIVEELEDEYGDGKKRYLMKYIR